MISPARRALFLSITLAAGLLLAACAGAPAIPVVSVSAAEFKFSAPDSIAGGLNRVKLSNTGKEDHHAQLLRLNDGVTLQQWDSTLKATLEAARTEGEAAFGRIFAVITTDGGPGAIPPGGSQDAILNLRPGQYVLVCFIGGADGVPHIAKGMTKPLTVTAAPSKQPAEPIAKSTISLGDYAFVVPSAPTKGPATVKVANIGKEPHEMNLLRLKGVTADQLRQALTAPPGAAMPPGPPPYEFAGGFQAMMPGQEGWITLDMKPGDYAMVCFIPSPANQGKPHVALGMFSSFTVK